MNFITRATKNGTLYEAVPRDTYFIATYDDGVVYGTGLNDTGWDKLKDGIIKLKYVVSTGKVVDIPVYDMYMHLVEASMSIDKDSGDLYGKNYHYVYVKGKAGDKVITHKIHLRAYAQDDIGKCEVYIDDVSELNKYGSSWKRGK